MEITKGKLVFIDCKYKESIFGYAFNKYTFTKNCVGKTVQAWRLPVIISETELIIDGDYHYSKGKTYLDNSNIEWCHKHKYKKVLLLPKQFSSNALKNIEEGKIKEGDVVYIKNLEIYVEEPTFKLSEVLKLTESAYDTGRYAIIDKDLDNTYDNWKSKHIKL